jgi:hypothetical protein
MDEAAKTRTSSNAKVLFMFVTLHLNTPFHR